MTLETFTLTFRQQALLVRVIEKQASDLRSKVSNSGLLTKEHLNEYEELLNLITAGHSVQVKTWTPEESA
jgi:hypothetical protein